jgi:hypothetical protein
MRNDDCNSSLSVPDDIPEQCLKGVVSAIEYQDEEVQAYRKRLRTFTPWNYFAKPVEISPILCAATGFRVLQPKSKSNVTRTVLLECEACQGHLGILVPSVLSMEATHILALYYQSKLVESHKAWCRWRSHAERLLASKNSKGKADDHSGVVPISLARLIPTSSSIALVQHPEPLELFISKWKIIYSKVIEAMQSSTLPPTNLILPTELKNYKIHSTTEQDESLMERLLAIVMDHATGKDCLSNDLEQKSAVIAIAQVLTGWDVCQQSPSCLECVFCLSQINLEQQEPDCSTSEDRSKRQRVTPRLCTSMVLDSHRYFCPWVRGLAIQDKDNRPLWQVLADRLLAPPKPSPAADSMPWIHVHNILQEGISSKTIPYAIKRDIRKKMLEK